MKLGSKPCKQRGGTQGKGRSKCEDRVEIMHYAFRGVTKTLVRQGGLGESIVGSELRGGGKGKRSHA